jgi:hypothetical protein
MAIVAVVVIVGIVSVVVVVVIDCTRILSFFYHLSIALINAAFGITCFVSTINCTYMNALVAYLNLHHS